MFIKKKKKYRDLRSSTGISCVQWWKDSLWSTSSPSYGTVRAIPSLSLSFLKMGLISISEGFYED